ncbi:BT_3044 domain-containing protein [Prevotella sp. 10(H)]|uniref:BT_3044 domain-containing protein n=1 Tax=Prevotella sp. 10(H) TaxID=1158294 RepID=UPI00068AB109|nr:DUF4361 domain-containing protein [Prevotella sp. 10(H)]
MNTIIKKLLLISAIFFIFIACDENEAFKEELYKKVICILSNNDKVFEVEYDLNYEESSGYVSINCGGTNRIDRDVFVEIEPETELLAEYNRLQYDTATLRFARKLPDWRYSIPTMSTTLKAGAQNTHSVIEVKVTPDGLSPDSIYMIPLRIKSVSDFEVNPDKDKVLFRVLIKNDYAEQKTTTYYKMRGTQRDDLGNDTPAIGVPTSSDKVFYPISKNKVRMLAGIRAFKDKAPTLQEIDQMAIIVTINDDNTITLKSAGSLPLEMIGEPEDNRYAEESGMQVFYFSYKYYWDNKWIIMTERCTRQKEALTV